MLPEQPDSVEGVALALKRCEQLRKEEGLAIELIPRRHVPRHVVVGVVRLHRLLFGRRRVSHVQTGALVQYTAYGKSTALRYSFTSPHWIIYSKGPPHVGCGWGAEPGGGGG